MKASLAFFAVVAVLAMALPTFAVSVRVESDVVRPNELATLAITLDAPADVVRIEGETILPTVWPAEGRTSGKVPVFLLATPPAGWSVTINGQSIPVENVSVSTEPATLPRAGVNPEAWGPTLGWQPTRPARQRWGVVIAFGVATLLFVTLALTTRRHPRARLIGFTVVGLIASAGFLTWRAVRPSVVQLTADLVLVDGETVTLDRWTWLGTLGNTPDTATVRTDGSTLPIAFSRQHLQALSPELHLDAAGRPERWTVTLPPDARAGFLTRVPLASAPPVVESGVGELRTLIRDAYRGWTATGVTADGAVVLTPRRP